MLEHLNTKPRPPRRVVVLGAKGFVGGAIIKRLEASGVMTLSLGRLELDLTSPNATRQLIGTISSDDVLVMVSAKAPVKDHHMLAENISMMTSVCDALQEVRPSHVVYISSDAVYADSTVPLTETSSAEPGSLHGVMHLARELMLQSICGAPLAILRPTLLYGIDDPHNGYGPNQYRRLAAAGEPIALFGKGEERRDHVLIDDVAEIVRRILFHRSVGVLNIATGSVTSFHDIAEMVAGHFEPAPEIVYKPRSGPMPHDGYRPFDSTGCQKAFPDFNYTRLADGLARTHKDTMENK
jgi:UDP-glucose 4-epimerase